MPVCTEVVGELRARFKAGATPSVLIRHVAVRHPDDPQPDWLVRAYFREAFGVPMLRVGPEQVRQIAAGGRLPSLNATVVPRMIEARPEWDHPAGPAADCWLDALPAAPTASADPEALPELAGSWGRMDDEAKGYVRRLLGDARALAERVHAVAALAEQLQHRPPTAGR